MAGIPKFGQDLINQGQRHTDQIANLREQTDDLGEQVDVSVKEIAELRTRIAVIEQKLEEQAKQLKKWDDRLWYLVGGLILAMLGLVASLIVALLKR